MSARLDHLYGARIDDTVRKIGECQCAGFVASFLDDRFAPGGERLLQPVADLLGELLCKPVAENGAFLPAYFDSEKTNLLDAIASIRNDKRLWAGRRLLSEMCAGEPYGLSRLGEESDADALENGAAFGAYLDMLSTAPLEIVYSGAPNRKPSPTPCAARCRNCPAPTCGCFPAFCPTPPAPTFCASRTPWT